MAQRVYRVHHRPGGMFHLVYGSTRICLKAYDDDAGVAPTYSFDPIQKWMPSEADATRIFSHKCLHISISVATHAYSKMPSRAAKLLPP